MSQNEVASLLERFQASVLLHAVGDAMGYLITIKFTLKKYKSSSLIYPK